MPQYPWRRWHVRWRQCLRLLSKTHVEGSHLRRKSVALTVSCCLAPPKNGGKLPAWQPCTCLLKVPSNTTATASCLGISRHSARRFVLVHKLVGYRPDIASYQLAISAKMPHFPLAATSDDGQESAAARTARIRIKTRRRKYLEKTPEYFDSPGLELAGADARCVYD